MEVIFYGKFFLNLTDQMFFALFFSAFCLTLRGHKAGLFTHIDSHFSSWQDLTSADAVLAFPFTFLKRCELFLCGYITF